MLINIGMDGDGVRRSVLHGVRTEYLDKSSPLYGQLANLKFLDLETCKMGVTFDFDAKHLAKRLRNNIINGTLENHLEPQILKDCSRP